MSTTSRRKKLDLVSVVGYESPEVAKIFIIFKRKHDDPSSNTANLECVGFEHFDDEKYKNIKLNKITENIETKILLIPILNFNEKIEYKVKCANRTCFGSFKLPNPHSRNLRVALISCNDIEEGINDNNHSPTLLKTVMWKKLKENLNNIDLIIHAGDQIYADSIKSKSFESYCERYADTWREKDVHEVLSSCPSVMMWDDHDIYNGFGSNDNDLSAENLNIFQAARKAFYYFQNALNPSNQFDQNLTDIIPNEVIENPNERPCFTNSFNIGKNLFLLLDARSNRNHQNGKILGDKQLANIENFLNSIEKDQIENMLVVTGLPLIQFTGFLFKRDWLEKNIDDLKDNWTSSNNINEFKKFMQLIFSFKEKTNTKITFLSGDIHVASCGKIINENNQEILQITSSGIVTMYPTWLVTIGTSVEGTIPFDGGYTGELIKIDKRDEIHQIFKGIVIYNRNFAIININNNNLSCRWIGEENFSILYKKIYIAKEEEKKLEILELENKKDEIITGIASVKEMNDSLIKSKNNNIKNINKNINKLKNDIEIIENLKNVDEQSSFFETEITNL
jgi:hypothetical protein